MFSIAAINDTDSRKQWEPLAPTKEAQEFHVTQTYHDGLVKLQAKEYDEARQLLESVLKDPLISNAQVDSNGSDGHLLQLRFLVLKNLATVFLQQGSSHYESALRCYLQAVEIDTKDSVVWNQLGTLSCSMGLLSISRWAFEQGLLCSPNNWNCMEKLLEVLIAIGDEVACLSVAELILRHWPSHSRALHVKNTIEESEPIPFAPRGIDKLEPKHVRLKFLDKRKAINENLDDTAACKRVKQNIESNLSEVSWASLIDTLLRMILPLNGCVSENSPEKPFRSGGVRLTINMPSSSDIVMGSAEKEVLNSIPTSESICTGDYISISVKEKDLSNFDEQPHERRSSRLERLRSRKPEKEEMDFANSKDLAKISLLEPFIVSRPESKESDHAAISSASCTYQTNVLDSEHDDVCVFIRETSQNYGAYHVAHMLLEWAASKAIVYQDAFIKLLELEKLTRDWGKDRTPECSLFLAELYYDIGSFPSNASRISEFMSEVSFHLCKIIESVALDYPFHLTDSSGSGRSPSKRSSEEGNRLLDEDSVSQDPFFSSASLANKSSFWTRYFWLSGKLSILDGNKTKAHEEFCISLSLLSRKESMSDSNFSVSLLHLKMNKELTINRVLHEINLLKVDLFLEKTVGGMIEKEMYVECINLLAPLLCSTANAHIVASPLPTTNKKGEEFTSIELSALDILIKAFEKVKPIDTEIYFNCHRRKLQILMAMAGMDEYKSLHHNSGLKASCASDIISKENPDKNWNQLVADEVKEISQCVSRMKTLVDPTVESNGIVNVMGIISNIQSLLLAVMCHVAVNYLCQKPSAPVIVGEAEKKHRCCFVDAGIAFCKLQHLIPTIPIKNQVELIVATHDLLAEYGLCCGGEDSKGEEGTFLKCAIKHLLALDMKLKSNSNTSNNGKNEHDKDLSPKTSKNDLKSNLLDLNLDGTEIGALDDDVSGGTPSKDITMHSSQENANAFMDCGKQCTDEGTNDCEKTTEQFIECGNELTEEEREELEILIDNALDQCFFCLYGLNIRSDSSYEDDVAIHKNTSRGDYQTKEQCADVFQYILPYAKASSKTGLVKLRRVLKAIRKHFPQPPEDVLAGNAIDKFLDDPDLCEDKLSDEAGSEDYLETITNIIFPDAGSIKQHRAFMVKSSEPYFDIYCNLYYFLALSEDMSATDKWPGFVLTNEGEEFVEQNANLFKYDLLYNPLRFESWQKLANLYDEEVDLLLNDGSKHINVAGWRKNASLPQRVDTSRRRSRRCLLMSLALAKTSDQQCEIHELLALVYYDSLQNVVPFYDQKTVVPLKDAAWELFCENSLKHFKKAFSNKQDWSHALYMGKLCEKLGYSYETSLSYYNKAIALNPSAVDPFYRMHASRLKLLCKCGKKDLEALKVLTGYSFSQSIKDAALNNLGSLTPEMSYSPVDARDIIAHENLERKREELYKLEEVWHMLYKDCLSALEICVEGDLKHFHKARYMLARGLYKRGLRGDLERAKDELSFCFKSSRSSFTINMWEIDGMVKKGRRKTPGVAGNKKALEVNLPESSRKFITCIRKYLLFYLQLLEETGDIGTLDRAFISLRADKRFSLCIEDLIPLTLGRYIKALVTSMNQDESVGNSGSSDHKLEKVFSLFIEQGNLWPEVVSLSEIRSAEISETSLYGYLHRYILSLEREGKLDTLEAINEKIRKRFKNPKLSDGNCSKVCQHASVAWCRSLIISLALITPLQAGHANESQALNQTEVGSENHLLFVDLQTSELWSTTFEDIACLGSLETKRSATLNKIKNVVIKKVSDDNVENANSLLRSSYNFYRDSSCVTIPFGVNLYLVPTHLATETQFQPGLNGVEVLDLSTPRKLLLWAYALVQGRYASISSVVKHCEENLKSKAKRGAGSSAAPSNMSASTATTAHTGGMKDAANHGESGEQEAATGRTVAPAFLPEGENNQSKNPSPSSGENQKNIFATSQSYHSSSSIHEKSPTGQGGGDPYRG